MPIRNLKKYILTSLITSFFTGCSSTKDMSRNQRKKGHFELYTYPHMIEKKEVDKRYKHLVVVSLNDLNGQVYPKSKSVITSNEKKAQVLSGGINAAKAYVDVIKKKFPNEVITVDAGSFLTNDIDPKKSIFLYNYLGIDLVNLGSQEFNLNTSSSDYSHYLSQIFKKANFKVISSNIYDLSSGEKVDWNFLTPSFIKDVNGLKVGFIGVHSQDKALKNSSNRLNGLYFQNMAKVIILDANKLRREGAEVIILLANHGIDCTSSLAYNLKISKEKTNFNPDDISHCEATQNELVKTLSLIPPNKIDLVVTAGKASKVANKFYNIPIMQNFGQGQYLSWAELYYDTKLHRVVTEQNTIHQPIELCHQFLEDNDDCFIEPSDNKKDIIPAKFLDETIKVSPLPAH